jgi:hypothetical protein
MALSCEGSEARKQDITVQRLGLERWAHEVRAREKPEPDARGVPVFRDYQPRRRA